MSGLARKPPSHRVVAALLELSRPECGTVGGDVVPPDVRFAGKCPAVTRAPPWTKIEMRNGAQT